MQGITQLKIRNEGTNAPSLIYIQCSIIILDEKKIAEAQEILQPSSDHPNVDHLDDDERKFWVDTIEDSLKPIPDELTRVNELRDDLNNLRNYTLIAMLLINLIWLILLAVFTFNELESYGLSKQILGLLFLAVYGIILSVQFVGMILHRLVTLAHYIARLNQDLPIEQTLPSREDETRV